MMENMRDTVVMHLMYNIYCMIYAGGLGPPKLSVINFSVISVSVHDVLHRIFTQLNLNGGLC